MGVNDNDPNWLLYLESKAFPLTEFWSLYLDWNHTKQPLPERLRVLRDLRRKYLKDYELICQAKKRTRNR